MHQFQENDFPVSTESELETIAIRKQLKHNQKYIDDKATGIEGIEHRD